MSIWGCFVTPQNSPMDHTVRITPTDIGVPWAGNDTQKLVQMYQLKILCICIDSTTHYEMMQTSQQHHCLTHVQGR